MANEIFPAWNNDDQPGSVTTLYEWVIGKAQAQIDWYDGKRIPEKKRAQQIRVCALILATLGGLCPLLSPLFSTNGTFLPTFGYVFVALSAAAVAFDKLYGFSRAWMRFAGAQLSLEIFLKEFQFDWRVLQSKPFSVEASLEMLKKFTANVDDIVKQETNIWITNFKNTIDKLEEKLKAKEERSGSGGGS